MGTTTAPTDRVCEQCGGPMVGKTMRARYCSSTCRSHKAKGRPASKPKRAAKPGVGAMVEAVRAELAAAGQESSALGAAALALAMRVDHGSSETGSAFAVLVKELRATLAVALVGATSVGDGVDELERRREAKVVRARSGSS